MEFLDSVGDKFNAFISGSERMITGIFGSSNEHKIKKLGFVREKDGSTTIVPGSMLDKINKFEPAWSAKSDEELLQTATIFRERIANGETLDELLPEAFAAVRESGKRNLQMRHYDVQLLGGYMLHLGQIAEMVTGEGKTLVSSLPAFLNALVQKVHVITVNDYLAKRDMEWMGPLHMALGLSVGAIQSNMRPNERQREYDCDITYGTNNEFGFDYLRDNMKPTADLQVQGPLGFAIIDEIDNILIDEARTPLIISGPAHDDLTKYPKANQIVKQLIKDVDFEVKEKEHTCHLTEQGVRHAEELAGVESFYTSGNMEWPHLLDNALKAHYLYKRDDNYVVENGAIVIVDEHTGRKMDGRQWSDGLHQAVESKEGVKVKEETQTLATITLQNYFRLYKKLGGMTGTAMTEAAEFWKVYELDVFAVPTNRPMKRIGHPDRIYRTEKEKWNAIVEEVREIHETGRPVLVGTVTIEQSELVSSKLKKYGVKHEVLNAKHHEREAEIVAQAGRKDAVTIATNMAGRGTDIILGGNPEHAAWEELKQTYESRLDVSKAEWDALTEQIAEREGMKAEGKVVGELGGLHVVGTERHDSRRIDLQLRGRAGRQGDPGSSRFIISLEDKLMRLFAGDFVRKVLSWAGMQENEPIESKMVTRRVEAAQKKTEERHFDQRKNLLEYDEVMDEQRKRVYAYRQQILDGANCRDLIHEMIDSQVDHWTEHFLSPTYRTQTISKWASQVLRVEVAANDVKDMNKEELKTYLNEQAERQAEDVITEQLEENLPVGEDFDPNMWSWQALSKWANRQFDLNTNVPELKKISRDQLHTYLADRAKDGISRYDYSAADDLLSDDFNSRSLCGWLNHQFGLKMTPNEFTDEPTAQTAQRIKDKLKDMYRDKEIMFPVAVGMTNFMSDDGDGGERYNRDGLVAWANARFRSELTPSDIERKPRQEVEALLANSSRIFYKGDDVPGQVDQYLDKAYKAPSNNGGPDDSTSSEPGDAAVLTEMANWATQEFESDLTADDFATLTRDEAHLKVMQQFDSRYRPELCQAERALLLEILDTAWKDHLYYMGNIRDGIGLVSYAQKDPKTEYKREGRVAFNSMWDRIGEQVTSAVFRLERESPAFVGSLWQITKVEHAEASTADRDEQQYEEQSGGVEPGQASTAIDPIINDMPKVGRNDPCPCGSGNKYKKCCGRI